MELLEFPAGAMIFMVGDTATSAFLIQTGTVELRRGTAGADDCQAQLGPGDVFGELSLIDERPHSLSARAVSAVQLSVLTRDEFDQLLTGVPAKFRVYVNTLFERLRTLASHKSQAGGSTGGSTVLALPTASQISVSIHPLTRRAAATLPREGLPITKFPFRIGRAAAENEEIPLDLNDLWLSDQLPFSVSRNHALIELEADRVILKDRGSSLGMLVNEIHIGGRSVSFELVLEEGDNIVVLGGPMSPYQFRINVARG